MSTYFKEGENIPPSQESGSALQSFNKYYQIINDRIQFYKRERWTVIALLALLYLIRCLITKGYFALTYCIGIHLLNSFIGFISPLRDPDEDDTMSEDSSFLPQR
jgi:hypothetical protein